MDDKKKILILALLAIAIIGIGAFQFKKLSPAPPAPASVESGAATSPAATIAKPATDPGGYRNPLHGSVLAQRDPFAESAQATSPARPEPELPVQRPPRLQGDMPAMPTGLAPFPVNPGPALPTDAPAMVRPQFAYTLVGTILGVKPAAVFENPEGVQKLVLLGAAIDHQSRVVEIHEGRVTVQFQGKTHRLSLGGNLE